LYRCDRFRKRARLLEYSFRRDSFRGKKVFLGWPARAY
jgi:hypothetical protein